MRKALLLATLLNAPILARAEGGYPSAPFQDAPARAAALTDPANSPITEAAIQGRHRAAGPSTVAGNADGGTAGPQPGIPHPGRARGHPEGGRNQLRRRRRPLRPGLRPQPRVCD